MQYFPKQSFSSPHTVSNPTLSPLHLRSAYLRLNVWQITTSSEWIQLCHFIYKLDILSRLNTGFCGLIFRTCWIIRILHFAQELLWRSLSSQRSKFPNSCMWAELNPLLIQSPSLGAGGINILATKTTQRAGCASTVGPWREAENTTRVNTFSILTQSLLCSFQDVEILHWHTSQETHFSCWEDILLLKHC